MDPEEAAITGGAVPEPVVGAPGAPPPARSSWLRTVGLALVLLLAITALAGFVIRVPYTTIAPGDALSLPPRVSVQGAKSYPNERGDIRLLFVREAYHVNLWQYVRASLDSDIDLAKDTAVNPGKLTGAQQQAEGFQQMADAKSYATAVAVAAAGYKVRVAPGLVVSDLTPGMPAIKTLTWGDVIISADGRTIKQSTDLNTAISKHAVGDEIPIVIERAGKRLTVHVKIAVFPDGAAKGKKGIGVDVGPLFTIPIKVSVDTTNIGGPSAGLAMTLAIYDDLTSGNLTGGARVAVTGTIDPDGNVGEIGGIAQKAVAARAAGVSLFIVPQCSPDDPPSYLASCKSDLVRAGKRAGSKIKVVPVLTFAEALKALRDAGGAPVPTTLPVTTSTVAA